MKPPYVRMSEILDDICKAVPGLSFAQQNAIYGVLSKNFQVVEATYETHREWEEKGKLDVKKVVRNSCVRQLAEALEQDGHHFTETEPTNLGTVHRFALVVLKPKKD